MNKITLIITILSLMIQNNLNGMKIEYPQKYSVEVSILSKNEVKAKVKNSEIDKTLHKNLTARTYKLNNSNIIIELFNGQGIQLGSREDFTLIDNITFIKNRVAFLPQRISYYIQLTKEETQRILEQNRAKLLEKYNSDNIEFYRSPFKVYELLNNQVIIEYKEEAYLYENLSALAFDNPAIQNIKYPNKEETGKEEFIKGKFPVDLQVYHYSVDKDETNQILKNYELLLKDSITLFMMKYILYSTTDNHFILLQDFKQTNYYKEEIEIGEVFFFTSQEDYKEKVELLKNTSLTGGYSYHPFEASSRKYGKNLPKNIFQEIEKLPALLNFAQEKLAFSNDCLEIINEAVKWHFDEPNFLEDAFIPILAYIGEYNKTRKVGDWKMVYDKEEKLWFPLFVDKNDKEIFYTIDFAKDFLGAEYGIPMLEWYIEK